MPRVSGRADTLRGRVWAEPRDARRGIRLGGVAAGRTAVPPRRGLSHFAPCVVVPGLGDKRRIPRRGGFFRGGKKNLGALRAALFILRWCLTFGGGGRRCCVSRHNASPWTRRHAPRSSHVCRRARRREGLGPRRGHSRARGVQPRRQTLVRGQHHRASPSVVGARHRERSRRPERRLPVHLRRRRVRASPHPRAHPVIPNPSPQPRPTTPRGVHRAPAPTLP